MTFQPEPMGDSGTFRASPAQSDLMMVQVRLPRELVREVDHFAIDQDLYRSQAFVRLLRAGLAAAEGA